MILDALEKGEKFERERLHFEEIAIAQLSSLLYRFNVTKPPYKSTEDFCFFKSQDKKFSTACCNTFQSLLDDQKIPTWAISEIPVMELIEGATDGRAKPPRAFVAVGILLICPEIVNLEWVQCDIAVFDTHIKPGIHVVYDCDTRQAFRVEIPEDAKNYEVNFVCELIKEGVIYG